MTLTATERERPPHMPNPNGNQGNDSEIVDYDLATLTPLQGPISQADFTEEITPGLLNLPTLQSPSRYRSDSALTERRIQALAFAGDYFRRVIDKDLAFSRRLCRDVFNSTETNLDDLLMSIRKVETKNGVGYTIRREAYSDLMGALYRVLKELKDFVLVEGYPVPPLPIWGKTGDINSFHSENDYEILAVAFRTEVEGFLKTFDLVYNFSEAQPRNANLFGIDETDANVSILHRDRSISLNKKKKFREDYHEEDEEPRTSTPQRSGRRHSSMFQYSSEGIGRIKNATLGGHARDKPPTTTLKSLLDNVGSRFKDGERDQIPPDSPSRPPRKPTNSGSPDKNNNGGTHGQSRGSPSDPSDDEDSYSSDDNSRRPRPPGPPRNPRQPANNAGNSQPKFPSNGEKPDRQPTQPQEAHFDTKLKPETVPKWDGNTNTLVRWIAKINNLALMSKTVFNQLESGHSRETPTIRYHEDTLMRMNSQNNFPRDRNRENREFSNRDYYSPRTHLVGAFKSMDPPKFPKDDSNVSKKGLTPGEKGARPCRHCGSDKHWDNECRHSYKSNRMARTNLSKSSTDEQEAQEEYDNLYYSLDISDSGDEEEVPDPNEPQVRTYHVQQDRRPEDRIPTTFPGLPTAPSKPPLNRRTRRRLAKEIQQLQASPVNYFAQQGRMIELKRHMSRPPGCSFLGAKATQTTAVVGSALDEPMKIIIDTGSDITLISSSALENLQIKPKIKNGQKINLIQVTGTSSISGFVDLDICFQTEEGPVKITVEAYVVKGMTTPFILGNDFADQYSISVVRRDGNTFLEFGSCGRSIQVENSTGSILSDEQGRTFQIRTLPELTSSNFKSRRHRQQQKLRAKERMRRHSGEVRANERQIIPPFSSKSLSVTPHVSNKETSIFVERQFICNKTMSVCIGNPDMLINADCPVLHISNFSETPYTVAKGQVLAHARNPRNWLDREDFYSVEEQAKINAHASLIRNL
ncbi:hypothetical protein GALMADRAFT_129935, partial [Galerina marginata CBS 339.88]